MAVYFIGYDGRASAAYSGRRDCAREEGMMTKRELLFSITRKDFDMQFFRAGGKGGQKQNKTSSACRIIHRDSGAVGESREQRSQTRNRKLAFNRLIKSDKFQRWLKIRVAEAMGDKAEIQRRVDRWMQPENLKIETFSN